MQHLDAGSPETQSVNLVAGNIERLRTLFPELLTEGTAGVTVNLDVLKQLVGDATVTDAEEKYGLPTGMASAAPASSPSRRPPAPCAPARKTAWTGTPPRTS